MSPRDDERKDVSGTFPLGRLIFFVTNNIHKFNEARMLLSKFNIATAMLRLKPPEIQDDNIENIAKTCALRASEETGLPVINS